MPVATRTGRLVAIVLVAAATVAAVVVLRGGRDDPVKALEAPLVPGVSAAPGESGDAVDPLAWRASRSDEFARAAARGFAHPLYTRVPGGPRATAGRVARYRRLVEEVAADVRVDPDLLEALVYLESAGRPDAAADPALEGAVGLTQILAETGRNLLGMRVDPAAARELTDRMAAAERRLRRAERRGHARRARRHERRLRDLRAQRRVVDERFDPAKALAAMGRYLEFARGELGRTDLALASYHMGVGNLQNVLRDYGADEPVAYARVYFDSTWLAHRRAFRRLQGFGDDSATYLWRLHAARTVMRLAREDPGELDRRAALMGRKNSAEELLHPPDETEVFESGRDLRDAYDDGALRRLPPKLLAAHGVSVDRGMGELAPRLKRRRATYRGLRPEALAVLVYLAAGTRAQVRDARLILTSTVRDEPYQRLLAGVNVQATREFSLHTTGYAFDVSRRNLGPRREAAVRAVLTRLQAHDLIAWVEEHGAFHVVASERARALLPVLG